MFTLYTIKINLRTYQTTSVVEAALFCDHYKIDTDTVSEGETATRLPFIVTIDDWD